ncbi:MAG: anti-sigma factor family protein [Planctomycetota bacterium]|jgi:hypothetical protein
MIDDHLRDELNAMVDGELGEERAAQLAARIDSEPELQAEFDRLRRVADLVRSLPPARASLVDDVMDRLPGQGRIIRPWAWAGGVAATAAAVLLGIVMLREDPPEQTWTQAHEPVGTLAEKKTKDARKRFDDEQAESAEEADAEDAAAELRLQGGKKAQPKRGARAKSGRSAPTAVGAAEVDPAGVDKSESVPLAPKLADERVRRLEARDELDLLRRVELKGRALDAADRSQYLQRLADLKDSELTAHLKRVGGKSSLPGSLPSASAKGKAQAPTWVFDLTVGTPEEAAALRKTLERAFKSSAAPSKKVRPNAFSAVDSVAGVMQYSWGATPQQAGTLVVWLERIGLPAIAPRGGVRPGAMQLGAAETAKSKEQPAIPVRVRIHYAKPGGKK